MSKITLSLFILLLLTSCATSKFDFATAYKFNTVKRYPSLGEKSLKVLASPEQVLPNRLSQSKSKIIETASLKSVVVASEDFIHSKLSTYKGLDNMSRKDTRRNNKLNKIITRLGDIKFDTVITESGLVIPLQEKAQEVSKTNNAAVTSLYLLIGAVLMALIANIITFAPALIFYMTSVVFAIIGLKSEKQRLASLVLQYGGAIFIIVLGILLFKGCLGGCENPLNAL